MLKEIFACPWWEKQKEECFGNLDHKRITVIKIFWMTVKPLFTNNGSNREIIITV